VNFEFVEIEFVMNCICDSLTHHLPYQGVMLMLKCLRDAFQRQSNVL
jgi:hypothetical protein